MDKDVKKYAGKRRRPQQVVLGKWDVHMQKSKIRPVSITLHKTQTQMDQRWKPEVLKMLEENIQDIGEGETS